MNLNSALASTHSLKKCSYKMLRKMHSLEHRGSLRTCPKLGNEYYIILCLQHMAEVIQAAYPNTDGASEAVSNLESLICAVKNTTTDRMRVDRTLLVACLKKHTQVFNWLRDNKVRIAIDHDLREQWSLKCVVAYVCQFGNCI